MSGKYRSEIDGLRAFAVISVIINHFNNDLLPNGYLGVDIFFVISGYVITSSLYGRRGNNIFEFLCNFYSRRIKRLVPSLVFFIVIASLFICFFNIDPKFSLRTGFSSILGLSNLYLLKQSTQYFGQSAQLNVFTHTWSLGVEEQFYFLFPIFVWSSGYGKKTSNGSKYLFLLVLFLLILSIFSFFYFYAINQPISYFLMPTRFWEIGTGCLLFIGLQYKRIFFKRVELVNPFYPFVSMLIVFLLPIIQPPFANIIIVLLTAIFISCLKKETPLYEVFTNKRIVFIGLISYPLYLWHWGVISISRWTIGIHWWSLPFQIVLIYCLALFSYEFIEKPFRTDTKNIFKINKNIISFFLVSLTMFFNYFLDSRFKKNLYAGENKINWTNYDSRDTPFVENKCKTSKEFLFLGDSHAAVFKRVSNKYKCDNNFSIRVIDQSGTPYPFLNYKILNKTNLNKERQTYIEKALLKNPFPDKEEGFVVIGISAPAYFYDFIGNRKGRPIQHLKVEDSSVITKEEAMKSWLVNLDNLIKDNLNTRFILMSPTPDFKNLLPNYLCQKEWFRPFLNTKCSDKILRSFQIKRHIKYINEIKIITNNNNNAFYFDAFSSLCPEGQDYCFSNQNITGERFFHDDNHLSRKGVTIIMDGILEKFAVD